MGDRLTVIGSSDAFNSAGRCHACYVLEGDGFGPIMVDIGATGLLGLRRANRSPGELAALAITHLHGDHIGGYPYLLLDLMFRSQRTDPLPIVGPVETETRLDDLTRLAYRDIADREKPFATSFTELAPGDQAVLAGAEVTAFAADHMDLPDQPLCLRFRLPSGKVVGFTGDSKMNDGLRAVAAGADLLIADCSGLAPPAGRHCTWVDWEEALPTIGTGHVVLSHLSPDVRERAPELMKKAPAHVTLAFADDGMIIDI
ncbi:MAG: MBL fold metallo-hydrolase [Myxococcota bacterium]